MSGTGQRERYISVFTARASAFLGPRITVLGAMLCWEPKPGTVNVGSSGSQEPGLQYKPGLGFSFVCVAPDKSLHKPQFTLLFSVLM